MEPLTEREERFAQEYLVDLKQGPAYCRVRAAEGKAVTLESGYVMGHQLFGEPKVRRRINQLIDERKERTAITADAVLSRWWAIANADPNKLVKVRKECCRHCYGAEHKYQWRDEVEWAVAIENATLRADQLNEQLEMAGKARTALPAIPDNSGGYGFSSGKLPHPYCPRCDGKGADTWVDVADTNSLSGDEALLYAGAKQTKEGIEIRTRDQDAALVHVARHLGMLNDKLNLVFESLTDEQLAGFTRQAATQAGLVVGVAGSGPQETGVGNAEVDPRGTATVQASPITPP